MFYLGTITGSSGAYSNQATGVSGIGVFQIPPNVRSLYLVPQQSGILFEFFAATGTTGNTSQTTAARGAQLDGPNNISGPFRTVPNVCTVVSIFSPGVVSVRVYAGPTS